MLPGLSEQTDQKAIYAARRKDLINYIKEEHADKQGIVALFADFETDRVRFRQESSFYYFTGVTEPGVVLTIDMDGKSTLYIPNCFKERAKWMDNVIEPTQEWAKKLGFDAIEILGDTCKGYQLHPFFDKKEYKTFLNVLDKVICSKAFIFTLSPSNSYEYVTQRNILHHLDTMVEGIISACIDVSPLVAEMRSRKDMHEIGLIHQAIEITAMAHEAASQAIAHDMFESEVQASIEYIFTSSGSRPAFPSIVASGKRSTTLHYITNGHQMGHGDLVVVDIGAEFSYYCADLTRTYPVSGAFTKRQKEIYNLVLETQSYIADIAKAGYWLNNKDNPEKSLHHLAKKFLDERGYGKYFTHGIGHYLGLDVHDVGNYKRPLQDGDVFTIEPGIYIPEENIGIRIEDDYWIVKDSAIWLSESLPKKAEDIEALIMEGQRLQPDVPLEAINDEVGQS